MFIRITINEFKGAEKWRSDPVYCDGDAVISKPLPLPVNGFNIVLWAKIQGLEYSNNGYRSIAVVRRKDIFDFLKYTYKEPAQFMAFEELSPEQSIKLMGEAAKQLEIYKEAVDRLSSRRKFCLVWE
jgi:hypothetical protein